MALAAHRGSGDGSLASEQQLRALKSYAQASVVTALEESLAIGLEALDISIALLLGRCCRLLGEAEAALLRAGRCTVPAAEVLTDAEGRGIVSLPQEFARLEGYRWARTAHRGRGTVFRVDTFGSRGECVLCPDFCVVRAPAVGAFLEAALATTEGSSAAAAGCGAGQRRPAVWLRKGLGELAAQVRNMPKVPFNGVRAAVENMKSIVLVVPVATVAFKEPPEPRELGRKAARRHPLHVDAVEMGARLLLTFVPPASTPSGDLDKADAETLEAELGAQLFALSGERGRLCVRRRGGPPLDLARIWGATLDDVCTYLVRGWYNTLAAAPTTWHRLFVTVKRCDTLEAALGPQPGKGSFMALGRTEDPPPVCGYCGASPVVGCEVFEADDPGAGDGNGLCASCAAFVPGSQVFQQKLALSQCISGQPEKMVGTTDESLDDALLFESNESQVLPSEPSFDVWASSSQLGPFASTTSSRGGISLGAGPQEGWPDSVVPSGSTVLAVSGLLSLREPADGWDFEAPQTSSRLAHELTLATGSHRRAVRVISVQPEVGTTALLLGFVILHPAILEGTSPDIDLAASGQSFASSLKRDSTADPKVPLRMFRRLVTHLLEMSEDPNFNRSQRRQADDGTPSSRRSDNLRAKAMSLVGGPLLRPNDPQMPALPCALALVKPTGEVAPTMEVLETSSPQQAFGSTLQRLKNLIPQAQERLRGEDGKARTKMQEMLDKQEHFGAIAALPPSLSSDDIAGTENHPAGRAVMAIRYFQPNPEELALRLRELTAVRHAERCHQLLQIWGGAIITGSSGVGATAAGLAVLGRQEASFRGQSALDLAITACDRACIEALLLHVPKVPELVAHRDSRASNHAEVVAQLHGEANAEGVAEATVEAQAEVQAEAQAEVSTAPRASRAESAELHHGSPELLELLGAPNPVTGYAPIFAVAMTPGDHASHWVKDLVQRGADINGKGTRDGDPPLFAAVSRSEVSLARTMIKHRADVNARAGDGRPLLQVSIEKDDEAMIHLIMATPGCNLNVTDLRGRTPLVAALRSKKSMRAADLALMLVKARASVDQRDNNGAAPILHAAAVHKQELCDLMLERRADKDAVDPADGSHILHLVVQTGNRPLMQGLLDRNSNIHLPHPRDGRTVLHLAAGLRMTPLVRQLLELRAEVNAQSFVGDTALRLAVQAGDVEAAELLCQAKADPNLANRSGCAPIHAAVSSGDVALPQLLARFKADPHLADVRRWRPIHYGASVGDGKVVEWLLSNKADPDSRSFHGRTPRQLGRAGASQAMACVGEQSPRRAKLQLPSSSMAASSVVEESKSSIMRSQVSPSQISAMPLETSRTSSALPSLLGPPKARSSVAQTPRRPSRYSQHSARASIAEAGAKVIAEQNARK